jgi:(p)ppGpp synthase/HD superfamily hydrolase
MVQIMPNRRSEKWIDVAWSDKATNSLYRSTIALECRNRSGLATSVSSAISGMDVNIVTFNFNSGALECDSIQMETMVEVHSLSVLETLLQTLRQLPDVIEAKRRLPELEKNARIEH